MYLVLLQWEPYLRLFCILVMPSMMVYAYQVFSKSLDSNLVLLAWKNVRDCLTSLCLQRVMSLWREKEVKQKIPTSIEIFESILIF